VRANKAGCLDRCADGPTVVVYPEGVWYWIGTKADVTEIMERHILKGEIVDRLRMADPEASAMNMNFEPPFRKG
jgi:(2Fe-2S) ferredoxin